jgi:hypothetical protein
MADDQKHQLLIARSALASVSMPNGIALVRFGYRGISSNRMSENDPKPTYHTWRATDPK